MATAQIQILLPSIFFIVNCFLRQLYNIFAFHCITQFFVNTTFSISYNAEICNLIRYFIINDFAKTF